tara:strand:+ start:300 stop:875 length:576 start_codon:yes stop_codon:yes gene_type:complete
MNTKKIWKKPAKFLGPSQFATVLDLNPWMNKSQLKDLMENGAWIEKSSSCNFGISKEKIAIDYYKQNLLKENEKIITPKWKTHKKNKKIGGIADGIIVDENDNKIGLEIKCHPNKSQSLKDIPDYYMPQMCGYMDLYNIKEWILMSVAFQNDEIVDVNLISLDWYSIKGNWENQWFPKLNQFTKDINWNNK